MGYSTKAIVFALFCLAVSNLLATTVVNADAIAKQEEEKNHAHVLVDHGELSAYQFICDFIFIYISNTYIPTYHIYFHADVKKNWRKVLNEKTTMESVAKLTNKEDSLPSLKDEKYGYYGHGRYGYRGHGRYGYRGHGGYGYYRHPRYGYRGHGRYGYGHHHGYGHCYHC